MKDSTVSKMEIVQQEGSRQVKRAEAEYEEFNRTQKITSDFDKEVKRMLEKGGELQ